MTELAKLKLKVEEILNDRNKSRFEQQEAIGELIDDILSEEGRGLEAKPEPKHWPGMYRPPDDKNSYAVWSPRINEVSIASASAIKILRKRGECCAFLAEAEFVKAHMEARLEVIDRLAELNEGWRPQKGQNIWYPFLNRDTGELDFNYTKDTQFLPDWFHGKTLIIWQEVAEELGEEKIKLAIWPKYN